MDCSVCGFVDVECNNSILEGGYIARICDHCLNRYQADLYSQFPFQKQVRLRYLQKLEEFDEGQAEEYVMIIHDFFFFSKKWVEGKGDHPEDDSDLVRLHEMWTNQESEK